MRAPSLASALSVAAAVSLLLAPAAYATPQGDNGTVRILDTASGEVIHPDGPEVCTFSLDADGFDGTQRISWQIAERTESGTRGTVAETGTVTLDGRGRGDTGGLSLADGRYELIWNLGGGQDPAHSALFTVDCAQDDGHGGGTPPSRSADAGDRHSAGPAPDQDSPSPGSDPGAEPETEPETERPASTPAAPDRDGSDTGSESSGPSPNGGTDLAESGSGVPAGALATAAASLLGAGTYLVLRRRNGSPGHRR